MVSLTHSLTHSLVESQEYRQDEDDEQNQLKK